MKQKTKLQIIREAKGMTREELAYRASVSYAMISALESGRRNPSFNVIGKLADVLGVKTDDLRQKNIEDSEG